jgi:LysR family transcriptional activator of glutamate synthase operon
MEIHQLQYVIEVAKHRHFTHAAEEICVAQSSLSQQITKLEAELGVKLFDRTTRAVHPTSAGSEFIIYAHQILSEIETARQCMQAHIGLTKGTINIGAITTLESIGFVSLITSFHNMHPGLYLNIVTNGSYRLTELLHSSEINVAILTPPATTAINDDIEFFPLTNDEFVLVTPSNHPLAIKGMIDLAEAANENFIFPSVDQSISTIYFDACREAGFTPQIVCQSSHSETSLGLVSVGMGVALFPLDTVLAIKQTEFSIVRLTKPIIKHVALAILKRPYYSPAVKAFCDFVLSQPYRKPSMPK